MEKKKAGLFHASERDGVEYRKASLPSLIALKYYMCLPTSDMRRFMRMFLVLNFAFLFILLACTLVV